MESIIDFLGYVVPFLAVLSVVVFVHEYGHYWVAVRNRVKVETFSVGFGPELFGWSDKAGTRWKVAAIPLGGYVKMLGDADATSTTHDPAHERDADSFPAKSVWQRMAIVVAGPAANFIFAILVLAIVLVFVGRPFVPAVIGEVREDTAASAAGLLPEDRIVAIDGAVIDGFADLQAAVGERGAAPLPLTIERDGAQIELTVTPRPLDGEAGGRPVIGIVAAAPEYQTVNPLYAPFAATRQVFGMMGDILTAVGQIITGQRSAEELGGPLRIAQLSGEAAAGGLTSFTWLLIVLSVNLGLINLFPIPMLDGGHLVMYTVEALRGRPLAERSQEIAFRVGLAMVLALMVFATWNDLVNLQIVGSWGG